MTMAMTKNFDHRLPPFVQKITPSRRICENRPKIGRAARARVLETVANAKKKRHGRLEKKPQRHRPADPADQVFPNTCEHVHIFRPASNVLQFVRWCALCCRPRLPRPAFFDFTEMAKRCLGSHWGNRTAEEQREFVK